MRARLPLKSVLALLAAPFALAACADPAPLYVDQAWISASSSPDRPSAGYFVVHGGPEDATLRAVQSDVIQRIEMHDSVMEKGMMTMKPIDSVVVPAKSEIAFAPGGKHLMLFGLNPGAVQLGRASMTFFFSNGDRIIVDAKIQKQGEAAPAPATNSMSGMDHGNHEGSAN